MSTQEPPIQLRFIDRTQAVEGQWYPIIPTQKWSTRLEGGCPACVAKHLSLAIESLECLTLRKFDPEDVASLCACINYVVGNIE